MRPLDPRHPTENPRQRNERLSAAAAAIAAEPSELDALLEAASSPSDGGQAFEAVPPAKKTAKKKKAKR